MDSPRELFDLIGRAEMARALKVGRSAISEALRRFDSGEKLPASWFAVMRDFGEAIGAPVPEGWFAFKGREDAPVTGAAA